MTEHEIEKMLIKNGWTKHNKHYWSFEGSELMKTADAIYYYLTTQANKMPSRKAGQRLEGFFYNVVFYSSIVAIGIVPILLLLSIVSLAYGRKILLGV